MKSPVTSHPNLSHTSEWYHWKEEEVIYQIRWIMFKK